MRQSSTSIKVTVVAKFNLGDNIAIPVVHWRNRITIQEEAHMRVEELVEEPFEKNYTPSLSVYLDDVKDEDKTEIAGMLRGLMCAIEGWGVISGLTNEVFSTEGPVVLSFSSVGNAHYFKSCVDYYFSKQVLASLQVRKRFRRVT